MLFRSWAETFAKLLCGPPPADFPSRRWEAVRDSGLTFADRWASEAHRLGWEPEDVFGLHPVAPAARVDLRGLAWLLGDGSSVVAIDADGADILTASGWRQRFWRRGRGPAHSA